MTEQFYILSVYHSDPSVHMLTWWGHNSQGYTFDLKHAGRYSAEEAAKIKDSEGRNIPVACNLAEAVASQVVMFERRCTDILGTEIGKALFTSSGRY